MGLPSGTSFRSRLFRTKNIPAGQLETPLKRCLTTFDLTVLGCAHMIGSGIYVLSGEVLKDRTGPSIIISFLLSGFAALLCALCYAEFGARYPKAGSAYTYAYVGFGELWAFIIGWNVVLEHLIGAASTARAWSSYVNNLCDKRISNFTLSITGELGSDSSLIAAYPDVVAVVFAATVAIAVALGPRASLRFMTIFSASNIVVIVLTIVYGMTFVDFSNWTGQDENGNSRFFPFGFEGTLKGAATCFFAFIGFEGLATAGEEAENPSKSVPRATVLAMTIATSAYILMAGTLSLMVPFAYVEPESAFPAAFAYHDVEWARYVVGIGAVCAMTCGICASLFSLPRGVYAMASDGLLFSWWSRVNEKTRTPINACVTFTILVCIMTFIFDLAALIDFMSIGTLMAYTIVSAAVVVLRYRPGVDRDGQVDRGGELRVRLPLISSESVQGRLILMCISLMVICFAAIGIILNNLESLGVFGYIGLVIAAILSIASFLVIACHQQNSVELSFKVPLVPFIPCLSVFVNILMMTQLNIITWMRFLIWMAVGFAIYFLYGMRHSKENGNRTRIHQIAFSDVKENQSADMS